MKCKDCTTFDCQYRTTDAEKDCYYEQWTAKKSFDWQSFRAEAAKDILCSVILTFEAKESFDKTLDNAINNSIKAADKLISKLKEKEEKQNV